MHRGPYTTGTKNEVLRQMAVYAIRDQMALIDAYTPAYGKPDEAAMKVIADARAAIADFRRLASTCDRVPSSRRA